MAFKDKVVMKKILLVLVVGVSSFILASCNKEYTCSCEFPSNTAKNYEIKLEKMRHNDAKVVCADMNAHVDTISSDGACGLK
ncbi:MAG: hypothetical protein R2831_02290 [Chitinophagaceae bacterium]